MHANVTVSTVSINDRRPVKVFHSLFFTGLLIFRFASAVQRIHNVLNQKRLECMPLRTACIKYGLRTADYGLGIKHGLRYKMRSTDYVGKNRANWF